MKAIWRRAKQCRQYRYQVFLGLRSVAEKFHLVEHACRFGKDGTGINNFSLTQQTQRVEKLLGMMTVEEKVGQLHQLSLRGRIPGGHRSDRSPAGTAAGRGGNWKAGGGGTDEWPASGSAMGGGIRSGYSGGVAAGGAYGRRRGSCAAGRLRTRGEALLYLPGHDGAMPQLLQPPQHRPAREQEQILPPATWMLLWRPSIPSDLA